MLVSAGIQNIIQPLIDVFEAVLKFFHSAGVSWGFSIVLLTVAVRAVLLPLTIKQFGSMARMQQLQPEMKAIQSKYKEDKQRQQQEMMKFYKDNKVNPLGSCLPLVAQLPVFISLFYMLRQSLRGDICPAVQTAFQKSYAVKHQISLHAAASQTVQCGPHGHAGFLFIGDLTNKATGVTLVVLILLYVGSQLSSSLMMATPTMDATQRKIMLVMPLFFVVILFRYPAGLLVYWITTNTWTMAQQYVIRKRIGTQRQPAVAATDGAGGSAVVSTSVVPTGRRGAVKREADAADAANGAGNGASNGAGNGAFAGGGLGALVRGRTKSEPPAAVAAAARQGPPPRPPRKKKKRSGRRR